MKKQNGFISSSSSVSICYTDRSVFAGYTNVHNIATAWTVTSYGSPYTVYNNIHETFNTDSNYSWNTYASTSYMRIEYFLEAIEKLGEAYSQDTKVEMPLTNYSRNVASDDLYDGFVDIVITFPTMIRIAGIELLNPWITKTFTDDASDWMYLPTKFNIYKVDNSKINEALNEITYENDVACITSFDGVNKTIRPMRYDSIENDKNLIFLGNYEVNWKNKASHKCFFKYNSKDVTSLNLKNYENNVGTATWECKQVVLRIFKTGFSSSLKYKKVPGKNYTYIEENIYNNILMKEISYGTKYCGNEPTIENIIGLLGYSGISSDNNPTSDLNWSFGGRNSRSYVNADEISFTAGINYKLGGIQILLSPDIFSISEMKMYNYNGKSNNKVYIGEWNKDAKRIEYYGAKTIKTSPFIDIDNNSSTLSWRHNFNLPPKYLDAQMFIRFKMEYDSFSVGDIITNIVNVNNNPISMKLTGSTIEINLSNGIGFTNPTT